MKAILIAAAGALALTACATVSADGEPPVRPPSGTCKAEPGQNFVGQRASADVGSAILAATGATGIRWVPPRTAVTTEYAYGRATVGYDDDYRITSVGCN